MFFKSFKPHKSIATLFASASLAALSCGVAVHAQQAATSPAAPEKSVAVQTIDTMNKLWGVHPGMRANHAKGIVTSGTFTPTDAGSKLSTASVFAAKTIPVTVRFSDSTGVPDIADGSVNAAPQGMSVKFKLPDGHKMDIVANSLKYFPVANGEEFLALLNAIAASPPGTPSPTPIEAYFGAHPAALAAFQTAKTPASFAHDTYYGIDSFIFVDAAGKQQPFRFELVPVARNQFLTVAAGNAEKPDFLMQELPTRLKHNPVKFHLMAQIPGPNDPITDATKAWPANRKLVDLGTITITTAVADSDDAQKKLLFIPSDLPAGIIPSADPLITARNQAYGVSYSRRLGN